jgi:hypothetical protein
MFSGDKCYSIPRLLYSIDFAQMFLELGSVPVRCYGTAKLLYREHMDRTINITVQVKS